MNSTFIIEVFVIILGLFFSGNDGKDKHRKTYIIIISALLIIESGFRAKTVGADTWNYYMLLERCKNVSWGGIFSNTMEVRDYGFPILVKVFQLISGDYNFFLTIAALWFFIPLSIILYKYSSNILQLVFSFTLYLALFHIIALSALRQQIAMGFSFLAFLLFNRNKFVYGSLLLLLGSTIHVSLLLFFSVPIIYNFVNCKLYKTIHLVTLLSVYVIYLSARSLIGLMASFQNDDYYMSYTESEGSGAVTYIVLMILLSIFCYFAINQKYITSNQTLSLFYVNLPLLTIFVPLISLDGAMIRMGQYFTVYMMLLVPYAIDFFMGKKYRSEFYFIMITILVVYITRSTMEYEFCF